MQDTSTGRSRQRAAVPRPPREIGDEVRRRLLSRLPVTERRLHVIGISTPVLEAGEGPNLLLLHGPGGSALHWMRIIPALAARYRLIIPDLPGQGASVVMQGQLDAERVIAWLCALIGETCTTRPTLVGYALGGAIAARFAARAPTQVNHLVLIDSLGLAPFEPLREFAAALNEFLATPNVETHESLWRQCAHDLDALRNAMGNTWSAFESYNLDRANDPRVMASLHALMEHVGLPPIDPSELERILAPTTLIWGRHDRATPVATAEEISGRYGWPLHVIEDAADDPSIEKPESLARVLRSVLASNSATN